jgi:hypothetical protein
MDEQQQQMMEYGMEMGMNQYGEEGGKFHKIH